MGIMFLLHMSLLKDIPLQYNRLIDYGLLFKLLEIILKGHEDLIAVCKLDKI